MRLFLTSLLISFSCLNSIAQEGHEIKVKIDGFEENVLYLAYHYGSKQYIRDTVYRGADDSFVFTRTDEALEPGNYMVVIPPANNTFDLLINQDEQHFTVNTSLSDLVNSISFEGKTEDNRLFYKYLQYLNKQRTKLSEVKPDQNETEKTEFQNKINNEVKKYQVDLIEKNEGTLTASLVKASLPIDYPDFTGNGDEQNTKLWRYTQAHYFDNVDLSDDALLRTAILEQRIDYFIDKLQVQHPDTISVAIDQVLSEMGPEGENFKYFVVHFLNKYARSKIVGMDAVYVHLAEEYYGKGKASWTDPDQLEKIVDNAGRLKPLLIGKIAPDLILEKRDGSAFRLHTVKSEYTVLYFWQFDCGHCKKERPVLREFYNKFRDKGVEIVAVCTKGQQDVKGCWDYIDEHQLGSWTQLADPMNRSNMHKKYDIRSTPLLYLLDKDKKIISKRISAGQLEEVLDNIMNK